MRSTTYVHIHLLAAIAFASCATPPLSTTRPVPAAPAGPSFAVPAEEGDARFRDVRFRDGTRLDEVRIHYATAGTAHRGPDGAIDNAVLLLHWTSASSDVLRTAAYAEHLFGPGAPLDLARHYVVFVDAVGHGRSSKPSDGLRARFPAYGYEDMVTLQHRVVTETLGLTHLRAIVGLSMGGMNAWQWAVRHPGFMDAIVPIVALPAPISGRNLLWRRFVSQQIRRDPEWAGGEYVTQPRGWVEAFPVFRMLLDGVPHLGATLPDVAAADAFLSSARDTARRMDANDVLYALEASTDYDPSAALERVQTHVFALNFDDDEFNPASLGVLETSLKRVPRASFVLQRGDVASFGHFTQAHPELWARRLAPLFESLSTADRSAATESR